MKRPEWLVPGVRVIVDTPWEGEFATSPGVVTWVGTDGFHWTRDGFLSGWWHIEFRGVQPVVTQPALF